MLRKYGVPLYDEKMVYHLLDQIMSPNIKLKIQVKIYRLSHSTTFVKASTDISMAVARFYPSTNPSFRGFRKSGVYPTGRGYCSSVRGGRFNVRGHGRGRGGRGGRGIGGHGGGSGANENGIDISYVTRYFEDSELDVILNDTIKMITEYPVRIRFLEKKNKLTTRSVSAEKNNENQLILQIISLVQNSRRH